jgi:nitrogen fixation protein NifX
VAGIQGMTRETALRIAMAARAMPGVDVRAFVAALTDRYGAPLSEDKLARVTVADMKALLQGDDIVEPDLGREQIKAAVRYLWGEGLAVQDVPRPSPYVEGDMPGSLRVAVASNSGELIDGHFGSCARFLIYQVSRSDARLIDVRSTLNTDDAEDRNVARAELIRDCQLVYVQSIGGPAAAKVVRAGVHPVKLPEGGEAVAALARLQLTLDAPPPWLAKVVGVAPASLERFIGDAQT